MRVLLFAAAATAALMIAAPANACSVTGEYASAPAPKALADSKNGPCGYASGRSAKTLVQAVNMALNYCRSAGGKNCRITNRQGN